jgi:hypothetical protein
LVSAEVAKTLKQSEVDNDNGLYERLTEAICGGSDTSQILQDVIADVQIEEINALFQANFVISGCLARPKV